jgi:hypothetical protein
LGHQLGWVAYASARHKGLGVRDLSLQVVCCGSTLSTPHRANRG